MRAVAINSQIAIAVIRATVRPDRLPAVAFLANAPSATIATLKLSRKNSTAPIFFARASRQVKKQTAIQNVAHKMPRIVICGLRTCIPVIITTNANGLGSGNLRFARRGHTELAREFHELAPVAVVERDAALAALSHRPPFGVAG